MIHKDYSPHSLEILTCFALWTISGNIAEDVRNVAYEYNMEPLLLLSVIFELIKLALITWFFWFTIREAYKELKKQFLTWRIVRAINDYYRGKKRN